MYTFDDNTYSDLHKDAYGFRPRATAMCIWNALTPSEKQSHWNDLCALLEQNEAQARQLEKERIVSFEDRINDVIGLGAGNRKTALRWIASQETFYHGQCVEHFVWELGVLFTDYGRKLVEELAEVVEYEDMEWV